MTPKSVKRLEVGDDPPDNKKPAAAIKPGGFLDTRVSTGFPPGSRRYFRIGTGARNRTLLAGFGVPLTPCAHR